MLFYIGYNVVYTFACYASGWLADRYPKYAVLAIGYSLALIPAIALALPGTSLAKFAVVFVVSGLYMGVWETLENATAAEMLPSRIAWRGLWNPGHGERHRRLYLKCDRGAAVELHAGRRDDFGRRHVVGRIGDHLSHRSAGPHHDRGLTLALPDTPGR